MERGSIMSADAYSGTDHIEESVNITDSASTSLGIITAVIALLFAIAIVPFTKLGWFFPIICCCTMCVTFIYAAVHFFSESHVVYSHTYNNGLLEIAKLRKNGRKKLMFSAECESLEDMGKYTMDDTWWVPAGLEYKTTMSFAGSEVGVSKDIWVAFFNDNGKRTKIVFKPSEELVKVMKKQYPSKVRYNET